MAVEVEVDEQKCWALELLIVQAYRIRIGAGFCAVTLRRLLEDSALQLLLQQQSQETAKDMAPNRLIALVIVGRFEGRFGGAENVLDRPECLIDVSDGLCVAVAVS